VATGSNISITGGRASGSAWCLACEGASPFTADGGAFAAGSACDDASARACDRDLGANELDGLDELDELDGAALGIGRVAGVA